MLKEISLYAPIILKNLFKNSNGSFHEFPVTNSLKINRVNAFLKISRFYLTEKNVSGSGVASRSGLIKLSYQWTKLVLSSSREGSARSVIS